MFEALMQIFWIGTSIFLGVTLVIALIVLVSLYCSIANEEK